MQNYTFLICVLLTIPLQLIRAQSTPYKTRKSWTPEHINFLTLLDAYITEKACDLSSAQFQIKGSFDQVHNAMLKLVEQAQKIKQMQLNVKVYRANHETLYDSVNIAHFNNQFDRMHEQYVEIILAALNPYKTRK